LHTCCLEQMPWLVPGPTGQTGRILWFAHGPTRRPVHTCCLEQMPWLVHGPTGPTGPTPVCCLERILWYEPMQGFSRTRPACSDLLTKKDDRTKLQCNGFNLPAVYTLHPSVGALSLCHRRLLFSPPMMLTISPLRWPIFGLSHACFYIRIPAQPGI